MKRIQEESLFIICFGIRDAVEMRGKEEKMVLPPLGSLAS